MDGLVRMGGIVGHGVVYDADDCWMHGVRTIRSQPKPEAAVRVRVVRVYIEDVRHAGSVPAAIVAACDGSDKISSGPIGPEFSTSGPGLGWSKEHDVGDYADRALADEYGALGYVDEADGRMATLYDDEVEWTAESVVCLIAPSDEDALAYPEALGMMVRALTIHSARTDIAAWTALQERIRRAAEEAEE